MATDLLRRPEEITAEPEAEAQAHAVHSEEAELSGPTGWIRLTLVATLPVLAASFMSGGLFLGASARVWGAIAGVIGVGVAVGSGRMRNPVAMYSAIVGGVFLAGLVVVFPSGFGNVTNVTSQVRDAVELGEVLRPPVEFLPGWRALVGWVMAGLGFVTAWLAVVLRRPVIGILIPLPVIGIGAISLPSNEQVAGGLVAFVLLVAALAILSGARDDEARSFAYEMRRGLRVLPLLVLATGALYVASSSSWLFPPPLYDPTQDARLPKTVPLDQVEDRVLFTVDASFSGPWKTGSLDVYDGNDWRLPPFADSALIEVPETGIVNEDLRPAIRAEFTVRGLGGAVLPGLANTVGIRARGPVLAFDGRTGNIRLQQGQFEPGFQYTVVAGRIPTIDQLQRIVDPLPDEVLPFTEIPDPPPAVAALLERAPSGNSWDRLDFLRNEFLRSVVASGQGVPVSVPAERVQDMLAGSQVGTPYEIVAGQAMLARWAGVPSRIGYGFDGGEVGRDGLLEVRPRHGALFLEVFFPGYGWLPVIGDPLQAQESSSDDPQQFSDDVFISEDVAVRLFIPVLTILEPTIADEMRAFLARALPILAALVVVYVGWPYPYKLLRRGRRRSWASEAGPAARIAQAYGEWRDHVTDFGFKHTHDTPLMFLDSVSPDDEHTQLAWLTTRSLWGDLRGEVTDDDAATAEELSRSLRMRLSKSQAASLRMIAAFSRLSIRDSYARAIDEETRGKNWEKTSAPA